jgi:mannose-6-phosphate isomerase-like protein (cupin superfamily)
MDKFIIQDKPSLIPVPGGKLIEEHFGMGSILTGDYSIAHMTAPPGWGEPFQTPEFDEITYIISGKKQVEIEDKKIKLTKNQSIFVPRGTRVRYSNPFDVPVDYISVCIPAFTIGRVNREQ